MPKRKAVNIGMTSCQNCKNDSDIYKRLSWPQIALFCTDSQVTAAASVTPHPNMILPAVCCTSGQMCLDITLAESFLAFSVNISMKASCFH